MRGEAVVERPDSHIGVLDGWRALSILLVLFTHWVPTPRAWQLNSATGPAGMALFFTLSGFLITRLLLRDDRIAPFLVRRFCRIIPLAWLAMAILILANRPGAVVALANLGFLSNLPPARLMAGGQHLWSLCLEVQFYVLIALIVGIFGRRSLWFVPVGAVVVTVLRVVAHQPVSIVTWHRLDEILVGVCAALTHAELRRRDVIFRAAQWHIIMAAIALLICSHPASGWLQYARPYAAGAAVFLSLYLGSGPIRRCLTTRAGTYIASISYALYVIHGVLGATWLGGEVLPKLQRYALLPVLALCTFALAHLSTYYFEKPWMALGKRWAKRLTAAKVDRPLSAP